MINEDKLINIRSNILEDKYPTQDGINEMTKAFSNWTEFIPEKSSEQLHLVNKDGSFKNLVAPRWLCHLFGLRHHCSHIFLIWRDSSMGDVLILQLRSWNKQHAPGQLDVSVGGHVKIGQNGESAALMELKEELGLNLCDLKEGVLRHVLCYENYNENPNEYFYNTECRDIYEAGISTEFLARINFKDKEVSGLYFLPLNDSRSILQQNSIPITSSLKNSLPKYLDHYKTKE